MKLNDILCIWDLVSDSTMVYIHEGNNIIARGHWNQDNIQRFGFHNVLCFNRNFETDTLSVKLRGAD